MAIDMGTTVEFNEEPGNDLLVLTSADEPDAAVIDLLTVAVLLPATVQPAWARVAAAVAAMVPPPAGGTVHVSTTLPIGAGLSSSSALSVSLAMAFGIDPADAEGAAELVRTAESQATGVPGGIMDQLVSIAGRAGNALLLDCTALSWDYIPLPDAAQVVVAHCGQPRRLAGSEYATRRSECEAAQALVGPLSSASLEEVEAIGDPLLRRRARHVVTENARVRYAGEALGAGDLRAAGALMNESHRSLAEDFEVSTPALDELVARLVAMPGVHGARLTGAGFGGCAVALAERGALDTGSVPAWLVTATDGAWRER